MRPKAPAANAVAAQFDLIKPWIGQFDALATKEDIYNCFRLILNRLPNPEEWAGHSSRAGEPLSNVVRTYINSEEFKARKLLDAQTPSNIVKRHNGKFYVYANQDDPVLGVPALAGKYEPKVASTIEAILKHGDSFLDVGANLGYFSMLAASLVGSAGTVYAVEPNEQNVKLLESSRRANDFGNVSIIQAGAADKLEPLFLHSSLGNGSTAPVADGDDMFATRTVPGIPIDNMLAFRTQPIRLIKIDVEGFEYIALKGAERTLAEDKPDIIFEFQGSGHRNIGGPEFLQWLSGAGYGLTNISREPAAVGCQSIDEIMTDYHQAMVDHLDIWATLDKAALSRGTHVLVD